jgi:hypothetical protein
MNSNSLSFRRINLAIKGLTKSLWIGIAVILVVPTSLLLFIFANQGLQGVQNWLIPISGFVTLVTVAISSLIAVNNYRLNVEAEKRLNESAIVESNIKLLELFSKMMQIANNRQTPIVSEKVIEGLFSSKIITEDDYKDSDSTKARQKLDTAIITPYYGKATQVAIMGSIYTLGKKHPILKNAAIQGLSELQGFYPDIATQLKNYIEELKAISDDG